jgi:hypothetical protein
MASKIGIYVYYIQHNSIYCSVMLQGVVDADKKFLKIEVGGMGK